MLIRWVHVGPTVLAAFLASLVEFVEALTVVLAVGVVRGWRSALMGSAAATLVLLTIIALVGPALTRIPLDAMQLALNLGMDQDFSIETPLMRLTKADTWALAKGLGGDPLVEIVRADTHTCYLGARGELHHWGHGCGTCPACELRAKGWEAWDAMGRPAIAA